MTDHEDESVSNNEIDDIDFLPGIDESSGGRLEGAIEMLQKYGIVEGYRKWIGKSEPKGGRTESIMISCPMPNHRDANPSAWMNSDKGLWHCGVCQMGGDVIDFAAIGHGYPFPQYRTPGNSDFAKVLELALSDIGVDPNMLRAEPVTAPATPEAQGPEVAPEPEPEPDDEEALSLAFTALSDAKLDWEMVVADAPDSFLAAWMAAVKETDLPDEYLFWLGLQMVGLATGRDCCLGAGSAAYPNLWLTLLGPTGAGKSRAIRVAADIVRDALPFDPTDATNKGVSILATPGSGEALYEMFSWIPENETEPHPLRGLLEIDEMKELMAACARRGSTLREAFITLGDGIREKSHRTRSVGSITVRDPFMAVVVGGQPDAMNDIMSKNDMSSGFANRFIYVPATKKPRTPWQDRKPPDLTGLADKLRSLRAWATNHRNGPDEGVIEMETLAAMEFDEMCAWFDTVKERPDGDLYARLELHAMKLITILCVNRKIDIADQQVIKNTHHLIESTMQATHQVSEGLNINKYEYYRQAVLNAIEKARDRNQKPPSLSDINRGINYKKRDIHSTGLAIKELERSRVIACFSEMVNTGLGKTNRVVERFYLANEDKWWE